MVKPAVISCPLSSKDWICNTRFALNSAPLTVAAKSSVVVQGLHRWATRHIPWLEWYACQPPLIWPVTSSDLSRLQTFWVYLHGPAMVATCCYYMSLIYMLLRLYVPVRSWFRWLSSAIVCYCGLCVIVCVCVWMGCLSASKAWRLHVIMQRSHARFVRDGPTKRPLHLPLSKLNRKPKKCSMAVQVCARVCVGFCGGLGARSVGIGMIRHDWGMCSTTIPLPLGKWHRRWPGQKCNRFR